MAAAYNTKKHSSQNLNKKKFEAQEFRPTKWVTSEDKAKFCNQFVKFVEGDYQFKHFPKWFYNRLHLIFGHIAHYDQPGFYAEFFQTQVGKVAFEKQCAVWPYTHGDWGDVEQVLQGWLRQRRETVAVA